MNNKGVMRTFEAIIAAVIMILGIAFIISTPGTTYSPNPSWEVINAKTSAEDVLVVLEKGEIEGQSEIGYYILNRDITSLENKLKSLIPQSYSYSFNVFELKNTVFITTFGEAVKNPGSLSNGYIVGNDLLNNKDVWKYHEGETGWPSEFLIYFPNGGKVTIYGLLIVDQFDDLPGYDSVYINLENDLDFTSYSSKLPSNIPLKVGDYLTFSYSEGGTEYMYTYQISNIARDGNSITFALVDESVMIDFFGTNTKDVSIFNETFRFNLIDGGSVDILNIERKISEPNLYSVYIEGVKYGSWIDFGNLTENSALSMYRGNVVSISYNGVNGHVVVSLIPFKDNIIRIEDPAEIETSISAKRIVSVWDSNGVRAYYVSLIMGRRKI